MSGAYQFLIPNPLFDVESLVIDTIERQDNAEALGNNHFLSPPPSPTIHPFDGVEYDSDLTSLPSDTDTDGKNSTPSTPSLNPNALPELATPSSGPRAPGSSNRVLAHKLDSRPKKPLSEKRRRKRNEKSRASRTKRNQNQSQKPRKNLSKKHLATSESVTCDIDISKLPAASTGYVGLDGGPGSRKTYKLEDLVGEDSRFNFTLQKWDGSHTIVIVDKCDRVIAILAGHPKDENWPQVAAEAAEALESRRAQCHVPKKRAHRRGRFTALRTGVSFGGGQKKPGNLLNDPQNQKIVDELNGLKPFKRLAGFASSVLATWQPDLHKHYLENLNALHHKHPELVQIFPSSVFSAASYNLGPRTVCFPHKDFGNLACGLCAVTSLGSFDYTKGGHLILWELHLVVEFPPGSTILLPSAIVTHSNITVAKHEQRYSFAQYTAGGLFRWVDNGFKTRADYIATLSPDELQADAEKQLQRSQHGLSLLHTLNSNKK